MPANSAQREVDAGQRQANAAQLGRRLLRILAPTRVRNISLHDAAGELLWLNQGERSPERARHLQGALDAFALDGGLEFLERDVDEANRSLFFCLRTPSGDRAGVVHAVVSSRRRPDINQDTLRDRVLAAMRRFSDSPAPEPVGAPLAVPLAVPAPGLNPPELPPAVVSTAAVEPQPEPGAIPAEAPPAIAAEAPPEAAIAVAEAPSEAPVLVPAEPPTEMPAEAQLRLRPYARLRQVGNTRRYEVAEKVATSAEDLNRARRLIRLAQHRGHQGSPTPASFTLPVCKESVLAPDFLARVSDWLHDAGVAAEMIGFRLPASAWARDIEAAERFIKRCATLRCFVALDDFNLTRPGFALLRLPALRCLKLDPALTTKVLDDKFAQANVAGILKASRVLGLYCIAKAVKSDEQARWLASAGVEFADRLSRAGKGAATTRTARALQLASGT